MRVPETAVGIREAAPADRRAWLALRAALWPQDDHAAETGTYFGHGTIAGLPHTVLVAEADRALVGFAEVSLGAGAAAAEAHLEGWFVIDSWRRRGVGRALIEGAADWARRHGCQRLTSDTTPEYPDSLRAHRRCGFATVTSGAGAVQFVLALGVPAAGQGPRSTPLT